jgi:hypothetical protein
MLNYTMTEKDRTIRFRDYDSMEEWKIGELENWNYTSPPFLQPSKDNLLVYFGLITDGCFSRSAIKAAIGG